MCPRSNERDRCVSVAASQAIDQKKVTPDMTLAMVGPIALERMIQPLGPQRRIVGNEQQHDLLQSWPHSSEHRIEFDKWNSAEVKPVQSCPQSGPIGHRLIGTASQ